MKNVFTEGISNLNRINMATRIADTAMDKFEEFIDKIAEAVARGSKALEKREIFFITMNDNGDLYADGIPIGPDTGNPGIRGKCKIDFAKGEIRINDIAKNLTLYIKPASTIGYAGWFNKGNGDPSIIVDLINFDKNLKLAGKMIVNHDADTFAKVIWGAIAHGSNGDMKWFKSTLIHEASHAVDLIANMDIGTYGKGTRKEVNTNPRISPALSKKIARIPKKEIRDRIRKTHKAPGWFLKNYMGIYVEDAKLNDWFDIMYTHTSKYNPSAAEYNLGWINYMNRPTEINARLDEALSETLTGILGAIDDAFDAAIDSTDPARAAREQLELNRFTPDIGLMVKHTMNAANLVKDITPENRKSVIKRLYYIFDLIIGPIKEMLDALEHDKIFDPRPKLRNILNDLSTNESMSSYKEATIDRPDVNLSHKHTDVWYKHANMFESEDYSNPEDNTINELWAKFNIRRGSLKTLLPVTQEVMEKIDPESISGITDASRKKCARDMYVISALISGVKINNWELAMDFAQGNIALPRWFRSVFDNQDHILVVFSTLSDLQLESVYETYGPDIFAALARAAIRKKPELENQYLMHVLTIHHDEIGEILIDAIRSIRTKDTFTMPDSGFGNTIHKVRKLGKKSEYSHNPKARKPAELNSESKADEPIYTSDTAMVDKEEVHGNPFYHVSATGENFPVDGSGNNDIDIYWKLYYLIDDDIGALEAIISDSKMSSGVDGVPLKLLAGTAIPALMSEIGEESNILQIAEMATRIVDPSNLHVLPEFIAEMASTLTRKLSQDGDYLIKIFTNLVDNLPDICTVMDIPITADIIDAMSPDGDSINFWRDHAPRYLGADLDACNALVEKIENLEKNVVTEE